MNIIVLTPGPEATGITVFRPNHRAPVRTVPAPHASETQGLGLALQRANAAAPNGDTAVALYLPFGGDTFVRPTLLDNAAMERLRALAPLAPLHASAALAAAEVAGATLPKAARVVVSGSGFFTDLPEREASYGLDLDIARRGGLRRTGFHGLFHRASAETVHERRHAEHAGHSARMVSLCLEPRPEVAAVVGLRPVMVTGGVTPLEGLPGQTTCGEVDPSIVLELQRTMGWGPEEIDRVLTRESGLRGLAGVPVTVGEALTDHEPSIPLAGDVLRYRLLLAFGAARAALGQVDAVAVSGRFAAEGAELADDLIARLPNSARALTCSLHDSAERLAADAALDFVARKEYTHRCSASGKGSPLPL